MNIHSIFWTWNRKCVFDFLKSRKKLGWSGMVLLGMLIYKSSRLIPNSNWISECFGLDSRHHIWKKACFHWACSECNESKVHKLSLTINKYKEKKKSPQEKSQDHPTMRTKKEAHRKHNNIYIRAQSVVRLNEPTKRTTKWTSRLFCEIPSLFLSFRVCFSYSTLSVSVLV